MSEDTLSVYNRMADAYADADLTETPGFDAFVADLTPGARVLDLGCGPGVQAERLAAQGFDVLAIDGSAEMVARAAARPGVTAQQALFDDIGSLGRFGGVWASFSLLHAPRADFPRHLLALAAASLPGAPFALSMKAGIGEAVDSLGRFYAYYSEDELRGLLDDAGFEPREAWHGTGKGLAGNVEPWIVILAHA